VKDEGEDEEEEGEERQIEMGQDEVGDRR